MQLLRGLARVREREVGGSRAKAGQRVDKFRRVDWRGRRNRTFWMGVDCGWGQEARPPEQEKWGSQEGLFLLLLFFQVLDFFFFLNF